MLGHRCWRKWKVDDIEADAIDIHKGWLYQERKGGMACHHLQQHLGWAADDRCRHGGVRYCVRERKDSSEVFLSATIDLHLLTCFFQEHLAVINKEKDLRPYEAVPPEYLQAFKELWKDAGLQKVVEKGNEFALHDNLG